MMEYLLIIAVPLLAYLLGAIPFGFILVKLKTGQDVREIQSGRTGGTNAMRAAGVWIGLSTALLDGAKGVAAVWLARFLVPGNVWLEVIAPLAAIIGHNYSIFVIYRRSNGKLRIAGGAGGATCVGGSIGLWGPSVFAILPIAALIYYFIGYASVATMSVALLSIIVFALRAYLGLSPWQYILFGIVAEIILLWSLRPNIKALFQGSERLHGFRARLRKNQANKTAQAG